MRGHACATDYLLRDVAELAAQGVWHRQLAISCYGRLCPETYRIRDDVCQKIARRHGFAEHVLILRRLHEVIGDGANLLAPSPA
jgi:hypothetical protein